MLVQRNLIFVLQIAAVLIDRFGFSGDRAAQFYRVSEKVNAINSEACWIKAFCKCHSHLFTAVRVWVNKVSDFDNSHPVFYQQSGMTNHDHVTL